MCLFLASSDIIIAIHQLYSTSEIVIGLQEQLNISAGLVNQNDNPTLRGQLTPSVLTIFASIKSVSAGYHQCQMNIMALRVICIEIFNKIF